MFCILGCFAWALLGASSVLRGQEGAEDRTIQAMCQAGLSQTAVDYVQARLALVAEDASQTALWTMRLMEAHALSGLYQRSTAESHWAASAEVLRQFEMASPAHPRLAWLRWQHTRCLMLQAQAAVALYWAAPADSQPREQALAIIRQLLAELDNQEAEIKRLQPLAAREGLAGGSLPPAEQFAKLLVDVGLLRCEALLLRARLYPRDSADRIAAASDVDREAGEILSRTDPNWASRPQLSIAQAAARLELGDTAAAIRALEQLAKIAPLRIARVRAAALAVEALAEPPAGASLDLPGRLSRAAALQQLLEQLQAGPESQLARIQLALAELPLSTADAKPQQLERLLAQAKQLGATYGDYWQSRAEALLLGAAINRDQPLDSTSNTSNVALELLTVEVRQLLAAGQTQPAIERLLQYRDNEQAAGRGASALRVASQAAALLQRQQSWLAASEALAETCRQFAATPGAAEAHLQACFSLSQALRQPGAESTLAEQYQQLLLSQLQVWPDAAASDEAEEWLINWLSARGQEEVLVNTLLARAQSARDPLVAERSLLQWLSQVAVLDEMEVATQTIKACAVALKAQEFNLVADQAAASELAARSIFYWSAPQLQQQPLPSPPRATSLAENPWQQIVLAVRWLEGLRKGTTLDNIPAELRGWDPQQLPPLLRQGVARAVVEALDAQPAVDHERWTSLIKLDANWQKLLLDSRSPRLRAVGYRLQAWGEDRAAALDGLKQLASSAGRGGGALHLELAQALADAGSTYWEESSRIARTLAAYSPAGSELHLHARWRLYRNQLLMGQTAEAQRAAQLLLATQPSLSQLWKQRFEGLLAKGP